jgi:aldehyde dehydrogenase (NAD+)
MKCNSDNGRKLGVASVTDSSGAQRVAGVWRLWIGGKEVASRSGDYVPVMNPSTGNVLCQVARGVDIDVDLAVRAASEALPAWANMPGVSRGRILLEVARGIRENQSVLSNLETINTGKPLHESLQDVEKSAEAFEFYGSLSDKLFGKTIPVSPEFLNYTVKEPIGITAHISPWNYPLRLAVRSVAPALAAGNSVVLKPAEQTPLTALLLGQLLAEAGIPDGIFNVVPGLGAEAGAALAGHARLNHISFTGSVSTGIEVMQRAARNVVPVTLELGGKSPNIVFADADLDRALDGTLKAIFSNAGQVCCAGSRLLLQQPIYESFVDELIQRTRRISLGPGWEDPDMGPLISAEHRDHVLDWIELGEREGAELLLGGKAPSIASCPRGYYVEPTLLANVSNAARIAQEEIFGPVLTIFSFRTEEEAIRLANNSRYGLVAGVWTSNLDRAHKVAAQVQAGQIYINDFFSGSVASPFGGYKQSGFGRERGVEALTHYTQIKSVCLRMRV